MLTALVLNQLVGADLAMMSETFRYFTKLMSTSDAKGAQTKRGSGGGLGGRDHGIKIRHFQKKFLLLLLTGNIAE